MSNDNLMIGGGIFLILFSWMQIALAYVSYKSENKRNAYKRSDVVATPMGNVDLANVGLNYLELIALREKMIDSKHNLLLLRNIPSYQRIKEKLYRLLIAELKLHEHIKRYDFFPSNLDDCIKTINIVINAKSTKVKNGWTIFVLEDSSTHPVEGTEVLCFVPSWGSYGVLYLVYEDNGKTSWRYDSEYIVEIDFPLVWQQINTDHAKTQNNP